MKHRTFWEDRVVTKINERGEVEGDPLLAQVLRRFTDPSKADTNQIEGCKAGGGSAEDCFNNHYKDELKFIKDRGEPRKNYSIKHNA